MRQMAVVAAVFLGCATTEPQTTDHMSPVEMCGQAPIAPGFAVAYGSDGYAKLPNEEMQAISAFFNGQYDQWANCITSIK